MGFGRREWNWGNGIEESWRDGREWGIGGI